MNEPYCPACGSGAVAGHMCVRRPGFDELKAERDRYRAALTQIANAESGPWGRIAHNALHPEREAA